jgi:hypothetical protein
VIPRDVTHQTRNEVPSGRNNRSVSGKSNAPYDIAPFATADCADFTDTEKIPAPIFGESRLFAGLILEYSIYYGNCKKRRRKQLW